MLDLLVKALDRPDAIMGVLADLGLRHQTFGVKLEDYDAVGDSLLFTLQAGLRASFDQPTRTRLYGTIAGVMSGTAQPPIPLGHLH